jgi:predicted transcriptional regulator
MEEMTVNQAAGLLGKTDRTIRNYIKGGRIKARRIENQFGWEYRVYDLGEFTAPKCQPEGTAENPPESLPGKKSQTETALQVVSQENQRLWEENRQLREVNNRLAYDLGGRDQKIKELELSLEKARNLLPTPAGNGGGNIPAETLKIPSKSWWKKLFRI